MKNKLRFLVLIAIFTAFPAQYGARAQDQRIVPIYVLANSANDTSNLSTSTLKAILMLEENYWANKQRISVLMPPKSSAARKFLVEKLCRTTEPKIHRHWLFKQFSGKVPKTPRTAKRTATTLAYCLKYKGAIGFVVDYKSRPKLKVLTIDGKKPGDADYPLKYIE